MKSSEEIIRRAICLLIFADRCALEDKIFDGIRRSLEERENQRQTILGWLERKGYSVDLTSKEERILNTPVVKETNQEARLNHNDYECIEPLLWSIGLVDSLSSYDEFVLDNLHTPLQIGGKHTLESVLASCKVVPEAEVKKNREIAMLWYWRCMEARNKDAEIQNYTEAIRSIFGEEYIGILKNYKSFNMEKGDFVVNRKIISELNEMELAKLTVIAERRFYAFEWLFSEENWDEVDLVC